MALLRRAAVQDEQHSLAGRKNRFDPILPGRCGDEVYKTPSRHHWKRRAELPQTPRGRLPPVCRADTSPPDHVSAEATPEKSGRGLHSEKLTPEKASSEKISDKSDISKDGTIDVFEHTVPQVGQRIAVTSTFLSSSPSSSPRKRQLTQGLQGIVQKIGQDGDAIIKFDGIDDRHNVEKSHFDKLQKIAIYVRKGPKTTRRNHRPAKALPALDKSTTSSLKPIQEECSPAFVSPDQQLVTEPLASSGYLAPWQSKGAARVGGGVAQGMAVRASVLDSVKPFSVPSRGAGSRWSDMKSLYTELMHAINGTSVAQIAACAWQLEALGVTDWPEYRSAVVRLSSLRNLRDELENCLYLADVAEIERVLRDADSVGVRGSPQDSVTTGDTDLWPERLQAEEHLNKLHQLKDELFIASRGSSIMQLARVLRAAYDLQAESWSDTQQAERRFKVLQVLAKSLADAVISSCPTKLKEASSLAKSLTVSEHAEAPLGPLLAYVLKKLDAIESLISASASSDVRLLRTEVARAMRSQMSDTEGERYLRTPLQSARARLAELASLELELTEALRAANPGPLLAAVARAEALGCEGWELRKCARGRLHEVYGLEDGLLETMQGTARSSSSGPNTCKQARICDLADACALQTMLDAVKARRCNGGSEVSLWSGPQAQTEALLDVIVVRPVRILHIGILAEVDAAKIHGCSSDFFASLAADIRSCLDDSSQDVVVTRVAATCHGHVLEMLCKVSNAAHASCSVLRQLHEKLSADEISSPTKNNSSGCFSKPAHILHAFDVDDDAVALFEERFKKEADPQGAKSVDEDLLKTLPDQFSDVKSEVSCGTLSKLSFEEAEMAAGYILKVFDGMYEADANGEISWDSQSEVSCGTSSKLSFAEAEFSAIRCRSLVDELCSEMSDFGCNSDVGRVASSRTSSYGCEETSFTIIHDMLQSAAAVLQDDSAASDSFSKQVVAEACASSEDIEGLWEGAKCTSSAEVSVVSCDDEAFGSTLDEALVQRLSNSKNGSSIADCDVSVKSNGGRSHANSMEESFQLASALVQTLSIARRGSSITDVEESVASHGSDPVQNGACENLAKGALISEASSDQQKNESKSDPDAYASIATANSMEEAGSVAPPLDPPANIDKRKHSVATDTHVSVSSVAVGSSRKSLDEIAQTLAHAITSAAADEQLQGSVADENVSVASNAVASHRNSIDDIVNTVALAIASAGYDDQMAGSVADGDVSVVSNATRSCRNSVELADKFFQTTADAAECANQS